MSHLFISYSKKDIIFTRQLKKHLEKVGFDVWMDESEIHPGQNWGSELEQNILTSAAVLVVMSSNSRESDWVKNEVELARDKKIPIFPILLEGEVWFGLRHLQYEDMTNHVISLSEKFKASLHIAVHRSMVPASTQFNVKNPRSRPTLKESQAIIIAALITGICAILAAVILVIIPLLNNDDKSENNEGTHSASVSSTETPTETITATNEPSPLETATPTESSISTLTPSATFNPSATPTPTSSATTAPIATPIATTVSNLAYPCDGIIINPDSTASVINVIHLEASTGSPLGNSIRVGTVVLLQRKTSDGSSKEWYLIYEGVNRLGWIPARNVSPSANCPS